MSQRLPGSQPPGESRGDAQDVALCAASAAGDRQAFGRLYDRYCERVRHLAAARGVPADRVWDVVQETFMRALKALDRGQVPDRFDLWIRRIALHAAADQFRPSYTRQEESTDPRELPELQGAPTDHDLPIVVKSLITALDPGLRDIVALHVYDDLTLDEVAQVLRIPPGTVRSRLSRAYRLLETGLAKADDVGGKRIRSDAPRQGAGGAAGAGKPARHAPLRDPTPSGGPRTAGLADGMGLGTRVGPNERVTGGIES